MEIEAGRRFLMGYVLREKEAERTVYQEILLNNEKREREREKSLKERERDVTKLF